MVWYKIRHMHAACSLCSLAPYGEMGSPLSTPPPLRTLEDRYALYHSCPDFDGEQKCGALQFRVCLWFSSGKKNEWTKSVELPE